MELGAKAMIRVLVVDDSPLMCKILTNILNCDPEILVAGGRHARERGRRARASPQTGSHHDGYGHARHGWP